MRLGVEGGPEARGGYVQGHGPHVEAMPGRGGAEDGHGGKKMIGVEVKRY